MALSKSEVKRQFKRQEQAAAELAQLGASDLKKLPVSEMLKEEILACSGFKAGARKRQIKYLAKLMRTEDVALILQFLEKKKGSKLKENTLHHEAERVRDGVINEALAHQEYCLANQLNFEPDWQGELLGEALDHYQLDEGDLRRTVFQYARTRNQNHYREVFRMVRAAIDKRERFAQ